MFLKPIRLALILANLESAFQRCSFACQLGLNFCKTMLDMDCNYLIVTIILLVVEFSRCGLHVRSFFLIKNVLQVLNHEGVRNSNAVKKYFKFCCHLEGNMDIHSFSNFRWLDPHIQLQRRVMLYNTNKLKEEQQTQRGTN